MTTNERQAFSQKGNSVKQRELNKTRSKTSLKADGSITRTQKTQLNGKFESIVKEEEKENENQSNII